VRPGSLVGPTTLATLACVTAAFCWGLNAVIAAGAFERGVTPERLAQARVAVALVPLATYLLLFRRDLVTPPRSAIGALIGFGVSMAVVNFTYYVAIDRVPVGVAISLQYTAPVLVLIGTALVTRRPPGPVAWTAAVVTLIGAVLVSGALTGLASADPIGLAAGIGAAVSFATYLLSAELSGRRGARPVTSLLVGFVVASVLWAVVLPWWGWPFALLADPQVSLRVVAVGLLGTLLPFFLVLSALRVISAVVAGIAATTEPVFAAALAWLLLGQSLGPAQVVGAALVVIGVLLAQVSRRPDPEAVPAEVAA
jgi:drug/metabolite transporter (DMT)-like permease